MIHPYLREDIDLVIAGGATHVGGLAAAATEIDLAFNVRRVAGTSAGSLIAAAMAFGLTQSQLRAMVDSFLSPSLLDRSLYPPHRFGLHKGDALRAVLTEIFGDARLGDALVPLKIVVCSLWSRTPVVLDSQDPRYAKIRVVDALMASCAIPGWFRAVMLPFSPYGDHLFVDGGVAANFAMDVFDDLPNRRTVGVRLSQPEAPLSKPVKSIFDFCAAVIELLLWASNNAHISNKKFHNVVQVHALGSGLDFNLTQHQKDARWGEGVLAAQLWVADHYRRVG